uniref:Uncharacterized protein n=1 Tax=uncultured Desulfobacterium sp. TaxID=201089 RepID=E1YEC1_9BACT|nr:unknown protein [uncultured Desulfobacterium sp.]
MKILQSRQFERNVKKFTKQEKKSLDKQILKIADNPVIGSEKKATFEGSGGRDCLNSKMLFLSDKLLIQAAASFLGNVSQ